MKTDSTPMLFRVPLVPNYRTLKGILSGYNIPNTKARTALVLDISCSLSGCYENGLMQEIVNKMVPISFIFSQNDELHLWFYGVEAKIGPLINVSNYQTALSNWREIQREVGGNNNELVVIKEVIEANSDSKFPTFVLFITDGRVGNAESMKHKLVSSSDRRIFWQFVGVGGNDYSDLLHVCEREEGCTNNTNCIKLDDIMSITDNEVYSRMLEGFSRWIRNEMVL